MVFNLIFILISFLLFYFSSRAVNEETTAGGIRRACSLSDLATPASLNKQQQLHANHLQGILYFGYTFFLMLLKILSVLKITTKFCFFLHKMPTGLH